MKVLIKTLFTILIFTQFALAEEHRYEKKWYTDPGKDKPVSKKSELSVFAKELELSEDQINTYTKEGWKYFCGSDGICTLTKDLNVIVVKKSSSKIPTKAQTDTQQDRITKINENDTDLKGYKQAMEAVRNGKKVIMVLSGEDCPPCDELKKQLKTATLPKDTEIFILTKPSIRNTDGSVSFGNYGGQRIKDDPLFKTLAPHFNVFGGGTQYRIPITGILTKAKDGTPMGNFFNGDINDVIRELNK